MGVELFYGTDFAFAVVGGRLVSRPHGPQELGSPRHRTIGYCGRYEGV